MKYIKVKQPDRFPKLNWDKFADKITGFDNWCQMWKEWHLNKNNEQRRKTN